VSKIPVLGKSVFCNGVAGFSQKFDVVGEEFQEAGAKRFLPKPTKIYIKILYYIFSE